MQTVIQLCIDGTVEAAEMYKEAFNLSLGSDVKHDDGTFAHLSLMHENNEILSMTERSKASNDKGTKQPNDAQPTTAIGIYGLSKEAVNKAYEILKKDAKNILNGPTSCPWLELYFILTDKFGVMWQVGT